MSHRYVNVFYLQLTHGVVTVNDLKTIADGIEGLYNTNLKSSMPTSMDVDTVDITFFPSAGTEIRYTGSYSMIGTNPAAAVNDASACYVIDWVISDYYRGGHPRTYFPGVLTTAVTNGGLIDATVASSMVTNFNAVRNGINALTATNITAVVMGTVRFASGNAWLSPPRFVAYTSVKFGKKGYLGSQRRRILT